MTASGRRICRPRRTAISTMRYIMKALQLILFVDPPGIPVDTIRPETFPRGSQAQGNQVLGLGATRGLSRKTVQDIPGTVKSLREPLPSLRENRRKQFRFRI